MKIRIAAALFAFALFFSGCAKERDENEPPLSEAEQATEAPINETPDVEATFRRSTLYYLSDEGYLVPVTKLVPWEEGIASACLSYMVSTPENLSAAREMGLSTVIPAGVELSLSIRDGNALVDMKNLPPLPSADEELLLCEAIVNTLTEFSTVSTVTITRGGQGGRLENGTELPVRRSAYALNPEDPELSVMTGSVPLTLYFPNAGGAVTVPITRYVSGEPDIYTAVSALMAGTKARGLRECFPTGTLLLGAAIENGVATVNLSEDFKETKATPGLYSLAYRTLWLTLAERFDFTRLRIQVNGAEFAPEAAEIPNDVNVFALPRAGRALAGD